MTNYLLEKIEVFKRSTAEEKIPFQFVEFTGKNMIKYNIVNLPDVTE